MIPGENIDATVRAMMRAAADLKDQRGWQFVAVLTEELERGEVYEVRLRFGARPAEKGDQTWPWTPRERRESTFWVPRRLRRAGRKELERRPLNDVLKGDRL